MNIMQPHSSFRRVIAALLLTTLCASAPALHAQAQDRAKGEEMLRQARTDLAEANRLADAAISASEKAQADQAAAAQKRAAALKLQRDAFMLIHDSNRARAAELRARADELARRGRADLLELQRLKKAVENEEETAAGDNASVASIRAKIPSMKPAEQADAAKWADSTANQAAEEAAEANGLKPRIAPLQAEIDHLKTEIERMKQEAQRLAPEEK